jgi:prepilin-type N-terminal cleavage/methylation domain-containing protein
MTFQRGFTLFELLIALALVTLVVLGAAQLIGESVVLFEATGRAVRNPSITLAMATIRRDIQLAAGVASPGVPEWSDEPLELLGWDGHRVRLTVDDRALVRVGIDPAGQTTGRKVVMHGVESLAWRTPNPWTVDLKVTSRAASDPAPGQRGSVGQRVETRRFVLRASPFGRAW